MTAVGFKAYLDADSVIKEKEYLGKISEALEFDMKGA